MKKITVIGCGNGGQALAGYLSMMGHDVIVYADPAHPGGLEKIKKDNGVYLTGAIKGFANLTRVSYNLQASVEEAEIILLAIPAFACESVFAALLPYLQNNTIVLNLAGYFSAIFAHEHLRHSANTKNIILAELTSFPFACRINENGQVNIIAIKHFVGVAALPQDKTPFVIEQLKDVIPCPLRAKSSIVEVGLYNTSGIGHSPAILFNAARIGNQDSFYFYKDGISEETADVLVRLDNERVAIGNKCGYHIPKHFEVLNDYYGYQFKSILDYFKNSLIHNSIPFFPTTTKTRYVKEDVPFILVTWYSLAEIVGTVATGMKTLIDALSLLHNINYMESGRKMTPMLVENFR